MKKSYGYIGHERSGILATLARWIFSHTGWGWLARFGWTNILRAEAGERIEEGQPVYLKDGKMYRAKKD